MEAATGDVLRVGVLLGDPRFPYPHARDNQFGDDLARLLDHVREVNP